MGIRRISSGVHAAFPNSKVMMQFARRIGREKEDRKRKPFTPEFAKAEREDAAHNSKLLEEKLSEGLIGISESLPKPIGQEYYIGKILEIEKEVKTEIPVIYSHSPLNKGIFYLYVPINGEWKFFAAVETGTIRRFFKGAGTVDVKV